MINIVKYTEIHKSIVDRIKTKFPNIIFSTDIEKAITRPSFFIDLDNIKATDFMLEARDTNITARIYYFSSTVDNNKIELLEMYDDLTELFLTNNLVRIKKHMYYEIEEIEINIVDKVLHCYFDINISENYQRDKYELITGGDEITDKETGEPIIPGETVDPETGKPIIPTEKELMQKLNIKE